MFFAVIMAGGSGTRFWPLSRMEKPKQLLAITGKRSLLQETVDRLSGLVPNERILVITNRLQALETQKILEDLPPENIIGEPALRDTAPCIGLAAVLVTEREPSATLIVLPSDHFIHPKSLFQKSLKAAAEVVEKDPGALVTFGIRPSFPATGYGYIEQGEKEGEPNGIPLYCVRAFREKPDAETARSYLSSGRFFWNSGIFVWKAQALLREMERFLPGHFKGLMRIRASLGKRDWEEVFEREYNSFENISIDYGIMEKTEKAKILKVDYSWNDMGSWQSLEGLLPADGQGNTVAGLFHGVDCSGNIIFSEGRFVGAVGLKDWIVVSTEDAILVCPKERVQEVKVLVEQMKGKGLEKFL